MNIEKKHELVLLRLRYLKKEYEFAKDTYETACVEFLEAYQKKVLSLPEAQKDRIREAIKNQNDKIKISKKKVQNSNKNKSEEKETSAKKLFKEVAKVSHPDMILDSSDKDRERKEKLFKKANEAIEGNDYFDLIEVAEKLDVDIPPPTEEEVALLKESVSDMNKKIKQFKSTFAWIWYHADKKRVQVMSQYIARIISGNVRT